jgi:hypothetical protein
MVVGMKDILQFDLGKNAEIDSVTSDGRYLLRYTKVNGSINMISWSETGVNESLESDLIGQKITAKLQAELERRRLVSGNS